jgi:hypothetical protein
MAKVESSVKLRSKAKVPKRERSWRQCPWVRSGTFR